MEFEISWNFFLFDFLERQEVEMVALNETLEEQRAHIQILDSALSNAHGNVQRLEEECRLKEGYAERVKQMTRSLDQLQKGMLSQISMYTFFEYLAMLAIVKYSIKF